MTKRPLILIVLTLGIVSISTASIFIKLCPDAPPVVIASARLGIASLILVPGAIAVKGRKLFGVPRHYFKYILLSSIFLSAHFLLWITSLKYTSVLSSVVIVASNPIFVGFASYVLFNEKVHRYLFFGILLGVAGVILIAFSDMQTGPGLLYGDFLSLGGAVMASCYFIVGRKVRKKAHIFSYITPVYAITALILVGIVFIMGYDFSGYQQSTYIYFILLAIFPQLIGHSALNWSLRYVTATMVAVFVLGEPIGSSILAYFFLNETVTLIQIFGGILILSGIFMSLLEPSIMPPTPPITERMR